MTRREKLIEKMRNSPGSIRFNEVNALLKHSGFVLFNQRGAIARTIGQMGLS